MGGTCGRKIKQNVTYKRTIVGKHKLNNCWAYFAFNSSIILYAFNSCLLHYPIHFQPWSTCFSCEKCSSPQVYQVKGLENDLKTETCRRGLNIFSAVQQKLLNGHQNNEKKIKLITEHRQRIYGGLDFETITKRGWTTIV